MYIVPLNSSIKPLDILSQTNEPVRPENENSEASFTDIFKDAYNNVKETQRISDEDSIKVALGEIDDLHTVQLNSKKAAMAVETFVTLKNVAIDAYNEVMRMSI